MALSGRYLGQPEESTPSDAEHDIDDLYEKLDGIEGQLQLIYQKDNSVVVEYPEKASLSDAEIASLSDAVSDIKQSNNNLYTWVVVLAFIIVLFEIKKMFRASFKKWFND